MKDFRDNKGSTLIEIIVALIIIGVLAAIALPNIFNYVPRSRMQVNLNLQLQVQS